MKLFGKKKYPVSEDLINFSAQHVGTGQVGAYIKKLYKEERFTHLGYRVENSDKYGDLRFVIYTLPGARKIKQYFQDRCPAMVENECRALEGVPHKWNEWPNGFREVSDEEFEPKDEWTNKIWTKNGTVLFLRAVPFFLFLNVRNLTI